MVLLQGLHPAQAGRENVRSERDPQVADDERTLLDLAGQDARRQGLREDPPNLRMAFLEFREQLVDQHVLIAGEEDDELRIVDVTVQVGNVVHARHRDVDAVDQGRAPGRLDARDRPGRLSEGRRERRCESQRKTANVHPDSLRRRRPGPSPKRVRRGGYSLMIVYPC